MTEKELKNISLGLLEMFYQKTGKKLVVSKAFVKHLKKEPWFDEAKKYIIINKDVI